MKRQRLGAPEEFLSSSSTNRYARPGLVPPISSTANSSLIFPGVHSQPPDNISHSSPLMLPRSAEALYRIDPRSAPTLASSMHRSHNIGSSPMHLPRTSSLIQSRRVSLLRDIGKAGERERELPVSATNTSLVEGHGALFPPGASMRHMLTPGSQFNPGLHHPFEQPITMLGKMHQAYHQQSVNSNLTGEQQTASPRHSLSHSMMSGKVGPDMKKESSIMVKQEPDIKPVGNQNYLSIPGTTSTVSNHSIGEMLQRQSSGSLTSAKADQSGHPLTFVEHKSKEDLVQAMDKVDREISKVEAEISRLQKKKTQLEESAKKPPEPEKAETSPQRVEPKHRDLWQVIYAENRKKAEAVRAVLDGICRMYEMPVYNQPSDTKVYQDNLKKNEEMRPKLLNYFKHRKKLQNIREKYLGARYDQLMDQWQQKAEGIENNAKKKAKDARTREFFEKIFPEVRKQREQQERLDRVGTRGDTCRSDADFAEIVDGLTEQENQLQHMRQLAVVPPMLLDSEERRINFISNNGFIREPFKEFKESQQLDAWADHEKAIFKEKYVLHPKNFNVIASFIEKKSVADCILYYYLTKKANKYKALVRKQTLKPRKPKQTRANASSHAHEQSSSSSKDVSEKIDKDDIKKEANNESEETKVDRPPSPRMTRARKQTLNWTEEEINLVKEGFGKHGRDFSLISRILTNKSEQQVKSFYHNYKNKKKHGLEQLITESKKKKTRARHSAPSPDIASTATEEEAPQEARKTAEPPLVEDKPKSKKDKSEDNQNVDEKKKTKELTSVATVPPSKSLPETSDLAVASTSTSYIRTRRTTAALAAAASNDTPISDSAGVKRSSNDKSPVSNGEPAEKRNKKNERKGKSQEPGEDIKETLKEIESNEEKSVKGKSNYEDKLTEPDMSENVKKDDADIKPEEDVQTAELEMRSTDSQENIEKHGEGVKASNEKKLVVPTETITDNKLLKEKKALSEDRDSSATCSADEEPLSTSTQTTGRPKHDSPYAFDYNDSPTRIQLDTVRQPVCASASLATTEAIRAQSDGILNLAKAVPKDLDRSDERPQSLPPRSMIPSIPFSSKSNVTVPLVLPGVDNSRPNSTPVFGGFPLTNVSKSSSLLQPALFSASSAANASWRTISMTTSVGPSLGIQSIGNLKYTGPGTRPVILDMSKNQPPSNQPAAVVDLTKETSSVKPHGTLGRTSTTLSQHNWKDMTRHQYHPVHPSAGSLQKDFLPFTGQPGLVTSSLMRYPPIYSDKDKQAMKERAADIPEAVSVSALVFKSTKPHVVLPQQYKTETTTTQVLATKPSEAQRKREDSKIQLSMPQPLPLSSQIQPGKLYDSPASLSSRRYGSIATGLAIPSMESMHQGRLITTSSMPVAAASLRSQASSADRAAYEHIAGLRSASPRKTATRELAPSITDAASMEKDSVRYATKIPLSESPSLALKTANIRESFPTELRHGLLPTLPLSSASSPGHYYKHVPVLVPSSLKSVKQEINPDSHSGSKSASTDNLNSGIAPPVSLLEQFKLDPHQRNMFGISKERLIYANPSLLGTSNTMKDKMSDEMNLSPRSAMQHVMATQPKASERKHSSPMSMPPQAPVVHPENLSKHPLPVTQSITEKDITRPSSAARGTPDRNIGDNSAMSSHHRSLSAHSLHSVSKQQVPSFSDQMFLNAASPRMMLPPFANPSIPIPTSHADSQAARNAILQQYCLPVYPGVVSGFPSSAAVMRPYSPSGSESLENPRYDMTKDYMTAQTLKQLRSSHVSVGGNLPFVSIPLPSGLSNQSLLVNARNPLLGLHHPDSRAQIFQDRLNFIPGHTSVTSPHSSPRTGLTSVKVTQPQSPSSPHRTTTSNTRSRYESPGPPQYPHDMMAAHVAAERHKSASPLCVPSAERRTPTMHSPMIPAQNLPRERQHTPPTFYAYSPNEHQIKGSLTVPTFDARHLAPQSASPPTHTNVRKRSIKQEKPNDPIEVEHHRSSVGSESLRSHGASNLAGPSYMTSQPTSSNVESFRKDHDLSSQIPRGHVYDARQRPMQPRFIESGNSQGNLNFKSEVKREPLEKSGQELLSDMQQQEKTAADLRLTGRTTMTAAHLIHAIIDHRITQFSETLAQKHDEKGSEKTSKIDPKMRGQYVRQTVQDMSAKAPNEPTREMGSNIYSRKTEMLKSMSNIDGRGYNDHVNPGDIISTIGNNKRNLSLITAIPGHGQEEPEKLESIIRKALLTNQDSSSSARGSPLPVTDMTSSQTRPKSSTPGTHTAAAPSNRSISTEVKREVAHNVPSVYAAPMLSALSFRGQTNHGAQQLTPSANLSGRPSVVPGSANTSRLVSSSGIYHPQTPTVVERTSLPSTPHYEPLSDSD